jgi:hypothetical protein
MGYDVLHHISKVVLCVENVYRCFSSCSILENGEVVFDGITLWRIGWSEQDTDTIPVGQSFDFGRFVKADIVEEGNGTGRCLCKHMLHKSSKDGAVDISRDGVR